MAIFANKTANVVLLGFSFMFIFTAFQTSSGVEKTVLEGTNIEDKNAGYYSLAIIYITFAAANWLAPSVVSVLGQKWSMVVGGIVYSGFIATFLYPTVYLLYPGSVLLGVGAAVIWTAQGSYLTVNSNQETIGRHSGIFWALLQCSLLFGNIFVYYEFKGEEVIEAGTRFTLYAVLLVVSGLGLLCLFILKDRRYQEEEDNLLSISASRDGTVTAGAVDALKRSFALLKTNEMILLSVCTAYTGFELTFFSGVYGTAVGHTLRLGDNSKQLLGLSSVFIGIGEILGGASFGLFGSKVNKYGRDPIVILGLVVHLTAFYLIFLLLPGNSPIDDSWDFSYWMPNQYLALTCSFLLGLGDSCFNTQIYSLLGFMFPEDSAAAFALFKFVQSLAAAIGFFYSNYLLLQWQLLILTVTGVMGASCFCLVEWKASVTSGLGYSEIS